MSSKRISYFNEELIDENELENIKIEDCFDLNDIINNEKTYDILKNDHYFTYLSKMENTILDIYSYWKNTNKCSHFLDNDEYDLDGNDFVELIYKHIYKNYSAELFYDNIEFAKPLLEEETNKPIIKKEKIIINNNITKKKFDWNTKSYK